jgi:hypothetical protein
MAVEDAEMAGAQRRNATAQGKSPNSVPRVTIAIPPPDDGFHLGKRG